MSILSPDFHARLMAKYLPAVTPDDWVPLTATVVFSLQAGMRSQSVKVGEPLLGSTVSSTFESSG